VELTANEIAVATGGEVVAGSGETRATSVEIDTRRLRVRGLFVALRGTRDGHDFVPDALRVGASTLLVERDVPDLPSDATVVRVADTLVALGALARHARSRMGDRVVVGITGSAGKTATKDLTHAALGSARRVHASLASFNNEAGLPLTLLNAPEGTEVIVAEMGARFAGNIRELAEIAAPEIGVITQIGLAHAEHLGGREGIATVKGELLEALPSTGVAVLNADCDRSPALAARTAARVVWVGYGTTSDVRVSQVTLDPELRPRFVLESSAGRAAVALSVRGAHQVHNAAQAAAVALEIGVPLEDVVMGLAEAQGADQRMELVRTEDGIVVLNDAYNSNPTSATAALESLAALEVPGRRIAVLGEMLELGADSDAQHEALGALTAELGIDLLVAVGARAGRLAAGVSGRMPVVTVDDAAAASAALGGEVHAGDAVLVKASRAIGLERVADDLVHGRVPS
jgi:UDP-N-acetylmuramoyl-tripeptide--D-alanyl-D-alanine ligase